MIIGSVWQRGQIVTYFVKYSITVFHYIANTASAIPRVGLVYFNSFITKQDHRINGEGTSSRHQGCDDAYAEHSKNDTAEDDRVFWCGLVHDRRKDTGCQYTEDHASY